MQTTNHILLIRPFSFGYNTETAASNAFQVKLDRTVEQIRHTALAEFEVFADTLTSKGVNIHIFDDVEAPQLPDAVFPNNWVTFHADGTVILYPMAATNRRGERRIEIIDELRQHFEIERIIDLSHYESDDRFLEGTGSIVFDHVAPVAYASLSARTDEGLLREVCISLGYEPVCFRSHDSTRSEIYHTNVMMCVGDGFAVVCLDSITSGRGAVISRLTQTGHEVIEITLDQMSNFAGNMLALNGYLVMSQRAFNSISDEQRGRLGSYCELVPLAIDTIETVGGGSARCMIAEIFLPPR